MSLKSNPITITVTAPPPPPQSNVYQLAAGKRVKIAWPGVPNLGIQGYPPVVNVPQAMVQGVGYVDATQTAFVGLGIEYKLVDSGALDAYGRPIYVVQRVPNDGALYASCSVDGNYLTVTFADSLGNVIATATEYDPYNKPIGIRPGNPYDYSKWGSWFWGQSVAFSVINMDAYAALLAANIPGGAGNFLTDAKTGAGFAQFNVVVGQIQLVLPQPVITIADLGIAGANIHNIRITYFDSLGNALVAVSNPLHLVIPGSIAQDLYAVNPSDRGSITVQVAGPLSFLVSNGPVYSDGSPYTPNTVESNRLTI